MAPEQLEGRDGRRAHRHLRVRLRALRDGDGQEGLLGRDPGVPDRLDPPHAAGRDFRRRAGDAAGARPSRPDLPREGSRRPVAERGRPGARASLDRRRERGGRGGVRADPNTAPGSRTVVDGGGSRLLRRAGGDGLPVARRFPPESRASARAIRDRRSGREHLHRTAGGLTGRAFRRHGDRDRRAQPTVASTARCGGRARGARERKGRRPRRSGLPTADPSVTSRTGRSAGSSSPVDRRGRSPKRCSRSAGPGARTASSSFRPTRALVSTKCPPPAAPVRSSRSRRRRGSSS